VVPIFVRAAAGRTTNEFFFDECPEAKKREEGGEAGRKVVASLTKII
jgi:hypothetical protein